MKLISFLWLFILLASLYILFFGTFARDGTIMVGCSNVVQTRGGTICMDTAYRR